MKRMVPLILAALVGYVIILTYFVPAMEEWQSIGDEWFAILAAMAFILGGGSLLAMHLK